MVEINNRREATLFGRKVEKFGAKHGTGFILTCCHLNTYPDDTKYCSGHGLYGQYEHIHDDCPFKAWCAEIHERESKEKKE